MVESWSEKLISTIVSICLFSMFALADKALNLHGGGFVVMTAVVAYVLKVSQSV